MHFGTKADSLFEMPELTKLNERMAKVNEHKEQEKTEQELQGNSNNK